MPYPLDATGGNSHICAFLESTSLRRRATELHVKIARSSDRISPTLIDRPASLSRSHVARAFRAATSKSPQDYLQERRLSKAARLLEATERPITDTAFALGFSSPSALAQRFRRRFGTTPTAWRRGGR
ncbi:MAG: AraC family transcriptional regulator [Rhodopseudomonas palustris]|uniref:helix-turn-helix transcriptional regulator n=1 Tax=Rhodopseudomonas faecalis TaxID=99655 RepID=UPI000DA1A154|nr:MAG: AraC family transcriptional regulator [Rhodopseudomonas palustris]